MARKTKTNLTFQVTLRDLEGVKIPDVREFIKESLHQSGLKAPNGFDVDKMSIHLTNKETSYA